MKAVQRRQHGVALLAMVAIIVLAISGFVVARVAADSSDYVAVKRARNAVVLAQAKQALIGHLALQAAKSGEEDPGRLPCPESPGSAGTLLEGANGTCSAGTAIGRFPWRTVGMDKPLDADQEALWLVVSDGWFKVGGVSNLINSNSTGALNVDEVPNAAVALIVAPGAALAGQTRSAATLSYVNFLETYVSATSKFYTTGSSDSFNDQVVLVTTADIMPGLEAAIARRIEREIVPALQTVFTPAIWGFAGADPVYPLPAPFASPGPGALTSAYQGVDAIYQGLLPFNQNWGCTVQASDPRCSTTFLGYSKPIDDIQTAGGGSIRTQATCGWQSDLFVCTGEYLQPSISATVTIRVSNVAMGLRTFDLTNKVSFTAKNDTTGGWGTQTIAHTTTKVLNSDGSVTFTIAATALFPDIVTAGWGTYANYEVSIDRSVFGDHALLSSTDPGTCPSYGCTGWFVRNEWYRLLYYATAQGHTWGNFPPSCTTGTTCLTVTNGDADALHPITAGAQHAVLILAGRSINGSGRPSSIRSDYLEFDNATAAGTLALPYERQPVKPGAVANSATKSPFNDRIIVIATNP